jgi:hypothetical protein
MFRIVEDAIDRPSFDDPPKVHHDDIIRHLGDDAEVVGDEHDRHVILGLKSTQQIEYLCLCCYVKRGRRLVGDQQFRTARQRHRDHRPLTQSTAELVGVLVNALLWSGDAHVTQQIDDPSPDLAGRRFAMEDEGFTNLIANRVDRAEGGHRFLKDETDLRSPDRPNSRAVAVKLGKIHFGRATAPLDLARFDSAGPLDDPKDRSRRDTLSAAALPHDAQSSPREHVERSPIDRFDGSFIRMEIGF